MRSRGDSCIATRGGTRLHLVRYGPGERHGVHSHSRSSLTLVLCGRVEERVGAATEVGTALSAVVKPAGVPHADVFGDDGARTLLVELSPADEALAVSSGCWPGRWAWSHAEEVSRVMVRMAQALGPLSAAGEPGTDAGRPTPGDQVSTLDDLLFEALGAIPRPESVPRSVPPAWLARVRDALEAESTPIRSLASEERVHPVVLARQFRRTFGIAPSEYRRRARARRAAALLTGSRRALADVALEAGYADQAHLTRDLRTVLGVTPAAVRTLSRPN